VALCADLLSARALVWLATIRTDGELTRDAHLFFFDRYRRLAQWHRAHGKAARARHFEARAEDHYRSAGGDGPPYAAAMGMPRPFHFVQTTAIGGSAGRPDDAA